MAAPVNDWKIMNEAGSAELPLGEIGEISVARTGLMLKSGGLNGQGVLRCSRCII